MAKSGKGSKSSSSKKANKSEGTKKVKKSSLDTYLYFVSKGCLKKNNHKLGCFKGDLKEKYSELQTCYGDDIGFTFVPVYEHEDKYDELLEKLEDEQKSNSDGSLVNGLAQKDVKKFIKEVCEDDKLKFSTEARLKQKTEKKVTKEKTKKEPKKNAKKSKKVVVESESEEEAGSASEAEEAGSDSESDEEEVEVKTVASDSDSEVEVEEEEEPVVKTKGKSKKKGNGKKGTRSKSK